MVKNYRNTVSYIGYKLEEERQSGYKWKEESQSGYKLKDDSQLQWLQIKESQ
jgi:hypothetical protein